ncbi:MAG: thioredoxin family protein [Chloroflexus sp.]|nr:thioredoxin family protein [Chloroflexus sp.]
MATLELTLDDFERTVTDHPIAIVDFWAPWCGSCRGFAPALERASEARPELAFA